MSIIFVVHSDCIKAGHGPGRTTIMTAKKPWIEGRLGEDANIGQYMSK